MVGTPFFRGDYVFASPPNSEIRKAINRSLLAYIDTTDWQELLRHTWEMTDERARRRDRSDG